MENNTKFLKIGNRIVAKSNVDGLNYNLEPGIVYSVEIDRYTDEISFKISTDFSLPETIYESDRDKRFINRVLNHYTVTTNPITGVLLDGLKGSGKTITAKRIALNSNLPIIKIDNCFSPRNYQKLFNIIGDTEICIMFDEIDKLTDDYDESYLLKILDGIDTFGKKLVLFTCNDSDCIDVNLKDRCSRIRYHKIFESLGDETVKLVVESKIEDKKEAKSAFDFIKSNMKYITYDNLVSFIDEINENPNDTFEELFEDMNLSK